MKKENSTDVFGAAIIDYFRTGKEENIIVHSPDFDDDLIQVSYLFRNYDQMPRLEQVALNLCLGKVLDVGCGAGSHSLFLQNEKRLEVTAIDTSPGAIEICIERGIKDARNIAFQELKNEQFDTLLFLMNGTGIIGKLENIDMFFQQAEHLLDPEGQMIIDSSDLKFLFEPEDEQEFSEMGKYYGEMEYQLSYKNRKTEKFDWLFLDFNSLNLAAERNNFHCELLEEGDHFDYLAKITRRSL